MEYSYIKAKCSVCNYESLVEIFQFGISHIAGLNVICKSCVVLHEEYITQHPDAAKDISEWINGRQTTEMG